MFAIDNVEYIGFVWVENFISYSRLEITKSEYVKYNSRLVIFCLLKSDVYEKK
jgi:hypothetical protein